MNFNLKSSFSTQRAHAQPKELPFNLETEALNS